MMSLDLELSGTLFWISAIVTGLYLPITHFLRKKKYLSATTEDWSRKEAWSSSSLLGFLCLIGAIDSFPTYPELFLGFIFLLLFIGGFSYLNFRDGSKNFPIWFVVIGMGMVLVILNDYFQEEDQLAIAGLFYCFIVFFLVVRWLFRQIKSIIQLKNEKAKTELLHLKSQVNPHFFFNTLNNLYGWVGKDTKVAQELILKLSDMMRYSIYDGQKEEVTIKEEIAYLNNYIDLHKMRYHKKIDIQFNCSIEQEHDKIMPLLFIILLENAFKHGVENLREHAYVHIDLKTNDKEIVFSVENNFDKDAPTTESGIGLKNLKRRLELVYPRKHSLAFTKTENVYKAVLTLDLIPVKFGHVIDVLR